MLEKLFYNRKIAAGSIALVLLVLLISPHFLSYHYQDLFIFLVINILVVVSYRLMTLTGEWSLIHIVLMGVGAYTSALLTKNFGVSFWFALPLAGLGAALIAFLLSFPLFRTSQFYFLIGSFAAGESIRLIWINFTSVFGGTSGINDIPSPVLGEIDFFEPIPYYYLVLLIVSLCLFVLHRIEKSATGLILHSVHWKINLAASVGVNTWKYRVFAFVTSAFFVGIAGCLKIHYLGNVTPLQFNIEAMLFVLIWVIVGGYTNFWGPVLGVIFLTFFDEIFRGVGYLRPAIYGILLILAILFLPKGLEQFLTKLKTQVKLPKI